MSNILKMNVSTKVTITTKKWTKVKNHIFRVIICPFKRIKKILDSFSINSIISLIQLLICCLAYVAFFLWFLSSSEGSLLFFNPNSFKASDIRKVAVSVAGIKGDARKRRKNDTDTQFKDRPASTEPNSSQAKEVQKCHAWKYALWSDT